MLAQSSATILANKLSNVIALVLDLLFELCTDGQESSKTAETMARDRERMRLLPAEAEALGTQMLGQSNRPDRRSHAISLYRPTIADI